MSVAELCERIHDARQLRLALLQELRRLVPFDAFAWLLTDPSSEVGAAPIADVPCLPDLPRLIRLKYSTEINRWTQQTEPVARLHAVTGAQPEQSLVWRELLTDHDVSDVASIVFRDPFGCWAFLDLWRCAGVFTDEQARCLAQHVDTITAALRRCTLRTFSQWSQPRTRHPWPGPIVLVLSDQLEVRGQTPETEPYLRALVPPDGDRPPIPAGAYNVAAQLLATEAGIDDHPPATRVHLDEGDWLTLRAARIGDDIAVSIERASPTERLDLFRRSAGLTAREAELLDLLATGADTRTIAEHMFLSEHTVQDHLKSIFAKSGTRSRRELLARAVAP
jgi:DNA-binding CsgD family transcriptional regulator